MRTSRFDAVLRTSRARKIWLAVAGLVLAAAPSALVTADDGLAEPIYWKQTRFLIPYQWSGSSQGATAQLVRLFISKDQGQSWQAISDANPDLRGFTYHAEQDGEYWFSIRTIDGLGRSWPAGPHQPELSVIVDTTFPQIEQLGALLGRDGSLDIYWHLSDALLAADGLKIEIKPAGSNEWQPVVLPASSQGRASTNRGTVRTQVPAGTELVSLRAEAFDEAGNRSVRGAEIRLNAAGLDSQTRFPLLISGRREPPPNVHPGDDLTLRGGPADSGNATVGNTFQNPFVMQQPDAPANDGWQPSTSGSIVSSGNMVPVATSTRPPRVASQPWPADQVLGNDASETKSAQQSAASSGQPATVSNPFVGTSSPFHPVSLGEAQRTGIHDATSSAATTGGEARAATGSQASWFARFGVELPPGVTPTIVSSRTFDLAYSLDSVSQWGVSRVELWGTRDGGRSWRSYALDDDNRSPLAVTVEGEGIYGFRIVAQSAGGLAAKSPQPGELPEMWVGVDLERPQAELVSVQQGVGNLADHLVIRWRASDMNLESRPVSLFYASRAGGPWSAVATDLENTGQYVWRIERHLPGQFYLRLEVRDVAGNVATFQTPGPVALNRNPPSAHLRGVVSPPAAARQ